MGTVSFLFDGLRNLMSGRGTSVDRRTYDQYAFLPVNPQQAEAAYRSSWLMRKIIDIPPLDMTREWRTWQTDKNNIEKLEAEEKRLQLRAKAKRALTLARLWGGGAIILGVKDDDPTQPLDPGGIKLAGFQYAHVVSRYQLGTGAEITDPASPWYGKPDRFMLNASGTSMQVDIHPSRVIAFVGQKMPEGSMCGGADWFWGDPLLQSIEQALKNADLAQDGFASLIDESKIDIVKIPDLMNNVGSKEYEDRLLARLGAAALGKSTWRALMLDGAEEWEQRQVTWTGMPDILTSYLTIVAGAADIPVTRLLGQSPKGLQSTGDGEERDYKDMVKTQQDDLLVPALDRIDEVLIPSALGSHPADIYFTMNSLERISPKDAAEIESKRANTVKAYADTGLFPEDALAAMAKNAVIESGQWPGSEKAFEEATMDAPFEQPDPMDLLTPEQRAAMGPGQRPGAVATVPVKRAANDHRFTDATPRTLYVRRDVVNVAEIKAWAKKQGLPELQDGLHVTICHIEQPFDWMKIEGEWNQSDTGELTIQPGGVRIVEPLGNRTAVQLFTSSPLSWRHESIVRASGGQDKFDQYQPHFSLTGEPVDLTNVVPYRGKIVLGPEVFEEING